MDRTAIRQLIESLELRYRSASLHKPRVEALTAGQILGAKQNVSSHHLARALHQHESMKATVRTLLEILDQETTNLRNASSAVRNDSRPAVNLPHEILALIFEMACLEPVMDVYRLHSIRCSIMGTCSRWRSTLLQVPAVWSVIYTHSSITRIWPPPQSISSALDRSGGLPLLLHLHADGMDASMEIIDLLNNHAHRCETLHLKLVMGDGDMITGAHSWAMELLHTGLIKRMICLRSVVLESQGGATFESGVKLPFLANLNMHIEELSLDEYHLHFDYMPGFVPVFPSLRYLRIKGGFQSQSAVELIRSCPRVHTLVWGTSDADFFRRTDIFILPELKHLAVWGESATMCLQFMTAPQLELLVVNHNDAHLLGANFTMFPNLVSLLVNIRDRYWRSLPTSGMEQFLSHHPTIQELAPVHTNVSLAQYLGSKRNPTSSLRVPRLSKIIVPVCNDDEFDLNALEFAEEILQQRVKITRDAKLIVSFTSMAGVNLAPRLEDLLYKYPNNTELVRPQRDSDMMQDEVWQPKNCGFPRIQTW